MQDLLAQAQRMQQQLVEAQATASEQKVRGQAGGGAVQVTVSGGMEFLEVHIDPSVVDPNEIEMLEDLILAAVRDAVVRASEVTQLAMGGLDLGALTGLGGPGELGPRGGPGTPMA